MSNVIKYPSAYNSEEKRFLRTEKEGDQEPKVEKEEKNTSDHDMFHHQGVGEINRSLREREQRIQQEEAMLYEKADEIMRTASESAENIIAAANRQAANIRQQAESEGREMGFREGYQNGEAEVLQVKARLEEEFLIQKKEFDEEASRFESQFVDLASSVLEKITGIALEDKKEVILYLIERTLNNQEHKNQYILRVSKEDYEMITSHKQSLYACVKDGSTIEIMETDNMEKNKCIIEMDNGVIDCSLDVQLHNLMTDLRLLSGI